MSSFPKIYHGTAFKVKVGGIYKVNRGSGRYDGFTFRATGSRVAQKTGRILVDGIALENRGQFEKGLPCSFYSDGLILVDNKKSAQGGCENKCSCPLQLLMSDGCRCGAIVRYTERSNLR